MTDISAPPSSPVRAAAIFDFDGTLVPHIDHGRNPHPQLEAMKAEMQSIKEEGGVIIGNTGRPPEKIVGDTTGLAELPFDYVCSSVGTVILHAVKGEDGQTTLQPMREYAEYLSTPGDPRKIPYEKDRVDLFLSVQDHFTAQEPWKIGDTPRTGMYYTFQLPEGLTEEEKGAAVSAKIAEVKTYVTEVLKINEVDGLDAKCGVSREKILQDGTAILNIDVMSAKADKIGATKWLLDHIAAERREAGLEPLDSVIVAGDSGNDKSNMDTAYYKSIGLQPAYIVPGNGHDDLVKHVEGEKEKGAVIYRGEALSADLDDKSQEYYNHEHYGLGGTLQGLQAVREHLRERLAINREVPALAELPGFLETMHRKIAGLALVGDAAQAKEALQQDPYLTRQRDILEAAWEKGATPESVWRSIRNFSTERAEDLEAFRTRLAWASAPFKEIGELAGLADTRDITTGPSASTTVTQGEPGGRVEPQESRFRS